MAGELATTNLLLGIMAAVNVLEALAIIGVGIAGFILTPKVIDVVTGIEACQVAPAMAGVNASLEDVKAVSVSVKEETERVDHTVHSAMDRIETTANRMRCNVRAKTSRFVGFVRGLRVAIEGVLHSEART